MPYAENDIPEPAKKMPKGAQSIYRSAFNTAYSKYGEKSAHAIAMAAVKKKFQKKGDSWMMKSEVLSSKKVEYKSEVGQAPHALITIASGLEDSSGDIFTKECLKDIAQQIKDKPAYLGSLKGSLDHEHIVSGNRTLLPRAKAVTGDYIDELNGVVIDSILNIHHPEFASLDGSIKDGFVDAASIEFRAKEWKPRDGFGRLIEKVELTGWGFTGRPVNEDCGLLDYSMKSEVELIASELDFEQASVDMIKQETAELKSEVKMAEEIKSIPSQPAEDFKSKYEAVVKELEEMKSKSSTDVLRKQLVEEIKSLVKEEIKSAIVQKPLSNEMTDECKSKLSSATITIADLASARNYKASGGK